jgi:probable addiction module antidote protein
MMAIKITRFDSTEFLDSDEAIGAYLEEALETDDPAFIAQALGTIAVRAACRKSPNRPGCLVKASTGH